MNIAEYAIRKKTVTLVMTVLLVVGGVFAYQNLGRLEDPEFVIKQALVITQYPGASPEKVQVEISDKIEEAAQELGQLDRVVSRSERGLSTVTVTIKDTYDKFTLPQVWDELRRKVSDVQLPAGAGRPKVLDDYGDVYGVFFAITGDGYSYEEIRKFADILQRELLLVSDVKRVALFGLQPEVIYVQMSREKMSNLGVSQARIYQLLSQKNLRADAGRVEVGGEYIPIHSPGGLGAVQEIENLLLSDPKAESLVYLKDVADVRRGYEDPARTKLRFNGQAAIGVGISTVTGGNVVNMGQAVAERLDQLKSQQPVGMEIGEISIQSTAVVTAIDAFMINLLEAVVIVIIVLLLFMGVRSGLIIGAILLITIMGSFIVMYMQGIMLERISLGALIISLGMLVDNAIVVTEGILIKLQKGQDRLRSAAEVVAQNITPLLGATVIAVLAFAAIGTSPDSTGEFCRSLFYVLLISLMISWVTAVTVTPLFCVMFLKVKTPADYDENRDVYTGIIYRTYHAVLGACIRFRWVTIAAMIGLLITAAVGFGFVDQMFFPNSTRPQFLIDVWMPEGTHIEETHKRVEAIEKHLAGLRDSGRGVGNVTSVVGSGTMRFLLTYAPEKPDSCYAQLLVDVDDYRKIDALAHSVQDHLDANLPDAMCTIKKFLLGPGNGGKIQARFRGPDPTKLRKLAEGAESVMHRDGGAKTIRNDWMEPVKVLKPVFNDAQARRLGITRADLSRAMAASFSGTTVGVYLENNRQIPIVSRAPRDERRAVGGINTLEIWSPAAGRMVPVSQVVSRFGVTWENAVIQRRNKMATITVHADPKSGLASTLRDRIAPKVQAMFDARETGGEYSLEWGGEYEDSIKGQAGVMGMLPVFILLMILIVVFLFNAIRQTLIIWLCVPLAIIGVTAGLLITGQPFGFMALLGLLSLIGMLIKNAIVLIDQIDLEIRQGKEKRLAVLDSSVSRMRPVMMAAATTVLGMTPLVFDAFYVSMAVTIMFGLTFAAVLTLIVVPVFYSIFFGISRSAE